MYLNKRQKELVRKAIEDYNFIKEEIQYQISKGNKLEDLSKFITKFRNVEITNYDEEYTDCTRYLDFNYNNVNTFVFQNTDGIIKVSNTLEIWDNIDERYIIEDWVDLAEYEDILNTPKKDILNELAVELKYCYSHCSKVMYDDAVEKIINFIKEEY